MDNQAVREWMKGYQAARTRCLTLGVETARHRKSADMSLSFESGYDWGLWDYEDANGLPHSRRHGA